MPAIIDSDVRGGHVWHRLPTEIRQHILAQLDATDIIHLIHTCKQLYNTVRLDYPVWRGLFHRSFPACDAEEDWLTWRYAHSDDDDEKEEDVCKYQRQGHTWRAHIGTRINTDWWQLYWERARLEHNWRQGRFAAASIPLAMTDGATVASTAADELAQLDILATRAWGTLFSCGMTGIWIVVHVAGQPLSPMTRLDVPLPPDEAASSSAVKIVSAMMTAQGCVIIHGSVLPANASDNAETPTPVADYLWQYRLSGTSMCHEQCVRIEGGSELLDVRGRWALWRHPRQPGPMTHCICDFGTGTCWPVLALAAGLDTEHVALEADDNGAIIADTAHLHRVDDRTVQVFQCRRLSRWFCWELVEHTTTTAAAAAMQASSPCHAHDAQRASRQTSVVARGALLLPGHGPLQAACTSYVHESMVLLQYTAYTSNATRATHLSAMSMASNRILWELSNLHPQRIIPVPERDFIVVCDARKRYLIRHLEDGLPRYVDTWSADARLEQAIGSVFLLGRHGRSEYTLQDVVSGNRLFTLPIAEAADIQQPATSQPCSARCCRLVASPVHLGHIDHDTGQFHCWTFA
ncbi:hypothetical protein SYNPS1DRAFT_28011 [Syncephalis pseudoplumigaleata]|uniref:F-box domain-containing protein n=1 Tax=Syncephalis pseudoplumigaleata TaxID=1712513 RepID=A0A4P9Z1C3_9FUNG|nr:hypothetical protein SYNPS1DRAFT_28011 [Syncephalis pseudoplumigaleata]|eukprot:RKP26293.1 hypothetical protein SYNPS1DRAFT_28011 [Syncephalis pseudoplumigaleata]